MMLRLPISSAAIALLLGFGSARAQSAPAQPAPVSATPQRTSAAFGDWVLNCQRIDENGGTRKLCEVSQTLTAKGQNGPVARIAIGRLNPTEPLRFTIVMPVNITPAITPRLLIGDKPTAAVSLAWQRCLSGGCFAAAMLEDAAVKQVRATTDQSRITFHDGADHDASLPMSPRGLPQALDALAKEDSAK